MKNLFLSAIENPGTPDLGIPRIHVAYEWDKSWDWHNALKGVAEECGA